MSAASHAAFAAFGLLWGTWGAALPAVRDAAGVGEAQLGSALLFIGLGALPAMLLTGRVVDQFGARVAGMLLVALAAAGVMTAVLTRDFLTLALSMVLVGATSGAADVASNALAGIAEQHSGRRVITVTHGVFSTAVVLGSLGTGTLRSAGADIVLVFAACGALMVIAAVVVVVLGPGPQALSTAVPRHRPRGLHPAMPLVLVGLVGALGFAVENAHQSWSAIFLADELGAGPELTATAPATFAAFAALTRFAAGALTRIPALGLLVGGAVVAVAGTLLLGVAQDVRLALVALALAAVGTSVMFPTLLSEATRGLPADRRGRATSAIATTAYLGFVVGPVFVGALAGWVGLRGALVGVAALAAAFALLAPVVTRSRAVGDRADSWIVDGVKGSDPRDARRTGHEQQTP